MPEFLKLFPMLKWNFNFYHFYCCVLVLRFPLSPVMWRLRPPSASHNLIRCVCCCYGKSGSFVILRPYDLVQTFQDFTSIFNNVESVHRDFIVLCLHLLSVCIRELFSLPMCMTFKFFLFLSHSDPILKILFPTTNHNL